VGGTKEKRYHGPCMGTHSMREAGIRGAPTWPIAGEWTRDEHRPEPFVGHPPPAPGGTRWRSSWAGDTHYSSTTWKKITSRPMERRTMQHFVTAAGEPKMSIGHQLEWPRQAGDPRLAPLSTNRPRVIGQAGFATRQPGKMRSGCGQALQRLASTDGVDRGRPLRRLQAGRPSFKARRR